MSRRRLKASNNRLFICTDCNFHSGRVISLATVSEANFGIIGGGIGGVAAAVALHQVGIDSVVYEKAPELREVGAGMMLWPNATRVLRRIGLLENVLARSAASTHFLVRATCGKVLMNIALGEFVTSLLPARLFEHNLRRMYSYEA